MTRTYESTHPFLTFAVDMRQAPASLWILLGEAQSKCEHLRGAPLPPVVQSELHQIYLAKGVLATTAIEGNTLSEEEVRRHMDGKLELPPSKEYLRQEIDNILRACNAIWDDDGSNGALSPQQICRFNAVVLEGLGLDPEVVPGRTRRHSVGVAGYRGAPWEDCDHLLERLCEWLNGKAFQAEQQLAIVYAVLKATLAHLYIAWIHPFGDGNGRTARLVEFFILAQAGVPMAAAHLLSNHYNSTRAEYYRQLAQASRSGDVLPFLIYAVQGFVDGLRGQLEHVRDTQLTLAWSDYVRERFRGSTSDADARRQQLVLALSYVDAADKHEIVKLSTDIATAYARKTSKTLTRDLNLLEKLGLVAQDGGVVRAKRYLMLAFRSKSKDPKVLREMREAFAPEPRLVRRRTNAGGPRGESRRPSRSR